MRMTEAEYAAQTARVILAGLPTTGKILPLTKAAPAKRTKFGAKKVYFDRIVFDSQAEAARYMELRVREEYNAISVLVVHPVFPLHVEGKRIGRYVADFRYYSDGVEIVEDVKSKPTAALRAFRRNCAHVLAEYGITITVVGA